MIRKFALLFIIIFSVIKSFGQTQNEVKDTTNTFIDISIFASPDYDFRMISGAGENGVTTDYLNGIEKFRFGYSTGLMFSKNVAKRISLQFGFIYQNYGYKTTTLQDTVFNHYDEPLYSKEYYKSVRYNAFDIPIMVRINLFNAGKTEFNLSVGAAPCFYIGKNTLKYFDDHVENEITKAERDIQVQGLFSLSVLIPVAYNLFIGIEPTLRYDILPMNDNVNIGIKRNPYSPGLGITLTYRLFDDVMYDYYYKNIYNKDKNNNKGVLKIKY